MNKMKKKGKNKRRGQGGRNRVQAREDDRHSSQEGNEGSSHIIVEILTYALAASCCGRLQKSRS